jgi:outer membrane cobalamin receptor
MTAGRVLLAALVGALGGVVAPLRAQAPRADGVIHGTVVDSSTDSAVVGAHVLLPGTPLTAITDERGDFWLVGLAPGRYRVRVIAFGYAPALRPAVTVAAGATLRLRVALARVPLQLAGIEVTATGSAQNLGEAPVSVAVLERNDILRHTASEIQDALPFVPGVDMNHGEVDIRGASGVSEGVGSRVLMLLDGHPVLTGDGGEIDYEQLPIMDLARAEVVKGSQSALYGSAAMGGVVNLITTPIDAQPATALKLHYGAYDLPGQFRFGGPRPDYWGVDAQHSRGVGPVGVRVALGREVSNGYQQNGEFSRWLVRTKLASMPGSTHPWDAYLIWATIREGMFYTWLSDSEPYQVPAVALGDWNRVSHLLAGGRYAALSGSRALFTLEPTIGWTEVKDHMHDSRNWHAATRGELNAQLAFNSGSEHSVTTGLDVAGTAVNSTYYGAKTITDAAPYGQEEFSLGSAFRVTAGVRVDYHHLDGARAEVKVNPKLAVSFTPGGPLALRASMSRGYRAPSAIEQFVSTTQQGARVVPNPSLHGETAWSGELGGSATLGRLWIDGALFESWYNGLIGPASVPDSVLVFSFQNVQRAVVRGVDATARLSVASRLLDVSLNYLYLDTRDDSTGLALPYRSRHTVTGSLDLLGGLAGVDVRYRSRLEQVLAYPLDPRSAITVVDLRLGARIKGVTFLARVSNLLQARYVDVMERNQGAPRGLVVTAMTGM